MGILCFLCACQSGRQQEAGSVVPTDGLKTIAVQVEEGMFEHLGDYLYADSYVCLDTVPLLGDIEKVEIKDDRIYVLDAFNKIVCYDMQGKALFVLDAQGGGPGEYASVTDFTVNARRQELLVYDRDKKVLLFYHPHTGQFLRSEPFSKPVPGALAAWQDTYFYDSRSHDSYPDDTSLHYSLLVSDDGTTVEAVTPIFWKNTTQSGAITAWYTSPAASADGTIDLSDQTDGLAYVLQAKTTATFGSTTTLPFIHQLAKVRVVLSGTQAAQVQSVEVHGNTSCTNNQGTVSGSGTQDWLKMKHTTYDDGTECWEANVVPGNITLTDFIRISGQTATINDGFPTTLEAAKMYTINLTLNTK